MTVFSGLNYLSFTIHGFYDVQCIALCLPAVVSDGDTELTTVKKTSLESNLLELYLSALQLRGRKRRYAEKSNYHLQVP